jgi:PBP1b-binding outer membrane lipoprotein LpoB
MTAMKINYALFFLTLSIFISSCSNSNEVKITVKDSDEEYQFSAHFDENKSSKIKRVIDDHIAPTRISSDGDVDVTTILHDKTKFHLDYDPGDVLIRLNKNENGKASYIRIKKMCEEIKKVIGEK